MARVVEEPADVRVGRISTPITGKIPLQVSAQTGEGLDALRGRIAERFEARFQVVELLVPYERGDVVSSLYALGPPIEIREDRADGVFIRARLPERELRRLAPFLVRDAVATAS